MLEAKTEVSSHKLEALTRRYLEAEGQQDWTTIDKLLDKDLKFRLGDREVGKQEYLAILKRLGLVWRGNRIKRVFVDGNEACALYDFLSDTPTEVVSCVEWIRFSGDKISEIDFLFEREKWGPVDEEMKRRAERAARA